MVSFGHQIGANRWISENFKSSSEFKFEMITDPNRILYKLFDLKKSYYKVWNTDCLSYYGEQLALSRQLPKAYHDVEDDPHQMGGNFILEYDSGDSNSFKIVYIYKSKTPNDRPSVQELLDFLNSKS